MIKYKKIYSCTAEGEIENCSSLSFSKRMPRLLRPEQAGRATEAAAAAE